jgi:hypothetical protein
MQTADQTEIRRYATCIETSRRVRWDKRVGRALASLMGGGVRP